MVARTALLALALAACAPRHADTPSGPAPTASSTPEPAPTASSTPEPAASATAAPPPAESASAAPPAAPPPYAPDFDEEMTCRRRHCYTPAVQHCFDVCYKYNHPRHPVTHDRCNAGCRHNYDLDACELACARDRRAFGRLPASVPQRCRASAAACRKACDPDRRGPCELACLASLEACEAAP